MHATLVPEQDNQSEGGTELHSNAGVSAPQASERPALRGVPHQADSTLAMATAHPGSAW